MNDPLATSGIVVVDKPAGMTSHDVVARLRRFFGTRKVGHAGTLDPMATGVLVAGIERGTKLLAHLVAEDKVYETTIRLGESTTTDDAEGDAVEKHDAFGVSDDAIRAEVQKLTGTIMQVPSKVSAIKIGGRRAHELVRAGEKVEIPAREVTIHAFELRGIRRDGEFVDVDARVHCSSGTYIRSLGRDLGAALGVGGHLIALRRSMWGPSPSATPARWKSWKPRRSCRSVWTRRSHAPGRYWTSRPRNTRRWPWANGWNRGDFQACTRRWGRTGGR